MLKIRYKGTKAKMPIFSPVGSRITKRSKVICEMAPGEELELPDEEAIALAGLDNINFELAKTLAPVVEVKEEQAEPVAETVKVKRKRRTKAEMNAAKQGDSGE